jgi:hypothetical protein
LCQLRPSLTIGAIATLIHSSARKRQATPVIGVPDILIHSSVMKRQPTPVIGVPDILIHSSVMKRQPTPVIGAPDILIPSFASQRHPCLQYRLTLYREGIICGEFPRSPKSTAIPTSGRCFLNATALTLAMLI